MIALTGPIGQPTTAGEKAVTFIRSPYGGKEIIKRTESSLSDSAVIIIGRRSCKQGRIAAGETPSLVCGITIIGTKPLNNYCQLSVTVTCLKCATAVDEREANI